MKEESSGNRKDPNNCNGGQECPPSPLTNRPSKEEGGFSNPPQSPSAPTPNGGLESPPSFFQPDEKIDKHQHRLPHWQQGEKWIFVTWRLADSLPKAKLDQWNEERSIWLQHHPEPWDEETERQYHARFSEQIDEWLDQGMGSCVLRDEVNALIVADALRHFNRDRYELSSFVVMPNHVHLLFRPLGGHALSDLVKSWKGYTARQINAKLVRKGPLWQEDYWDRLIRSEEHFFKVQEYIRENPAKARLQEGEYLLEN